MPSYSADHSDGQVNTTLRGSNIVGTEANDDEKAIAAINHAKADINGCGVPQSHVDPANGFLKSDIPGADRLP
jgi:hypothetical protein